MNIKHFSAALCAALITTSPGFAEEAPPAKPKDAMADCPPHAQHMFAAAAHGVDERGDKGMGFSHTKTTHHFRIFRDGGAIEVTTNDPSDQASRAQIRAHLAQIAQSFVAGDFKTPIFVHALMPDGAAVMQRMKTSIRYRYEKLPSGGRVRINTDEPCALTAVHDFLRFQIKEHRTGDPLEIGSQ